MVIAELHNFCVIQFFQFNHSSFWQIQILFCSCLKLSSSNSIFREGSKHCLCFSCKSLLCSEAQNRQAERTSLDFLVICQCFHCIFVAEATLPEWMSNHGRQWLGRSNWLSLAYQMCSSSWGVRPLKKCDLIFASILPRNILKYHYRLESMS